MIIWCTVSTLKMMKLNWSMVTIFNNHDCRSSMHNEGTWITWQHIHFLSNCNFLAIFKWWPVDNFSFRKTDFNFSRQYFISALIRYYLFSTKQKKIQNQITSIHASLWSNNQSFMVLFWKRTIRSVHLSIWFILYERKLRGKRETLLYRKLMKRGPGQDRGVQKTSVPILLEPQLSLPTSA